MLYHQSKRCHSDARTTALQKIGDIYDYAAVSLEGISHFEKLNKVCVYVYEIDEDTDDIIDCKKG